MLALGSPHPNYRAFRRAYKAALLEAKGCPSPLSPRGRQPALEGPLLATTRVQAHHPRPPRPAHIARTPSNPPDPPEMTPPAASHLSRLVATTRHLVALGTSTPCAAAADDAPPMHR